MLEFYRKDTESVLKAVQSSENGLTSDAVKAKLEQDGYNELKDREKVSTWKLFLETFKDPMVIVLLVAAGIQVVLGEIAESLIIFLVLLI